MDRIRIGEVIDFLHFRLWTGYSWPDFNFADSFIVVGVILLVLELLASEGVTRIARVAIPAGIATVRFLPSENPKAEVAIETVDAVACIRRTAITDGNFPKPP